jgi:hypothetical protein
MDDAPAPAPPPPPVPPLLPFDDAWQLRTRPSTFEGVVTPGEIVSLNHIRYLLCSHTTLPYLALSSRPMGCISWPFDEHLVPAECI